MKIAFAAALAALVSAASPVAAYDPGLERPAGAKSHKVRLVVLAEDGRKIEYPVRPAAKVVVYADFDIEGQTYPHRNVPFGRHRQTYLFQVDGWLTRDVEYAPGRDGVTVLTVRKAKQYDPAKGEEQ